MIPFHIDTIEPNEQNARSIVKLTNADLMRAGLPDIEALNLADANSDAHVEAQIKRLKDNPERYIGAVAVRDELVGFIKINEWTRGDQLPFLSTIQRIGQQAMIKVGHNHLNGLPQGVHGLVVDESVDDEQSIGMALLRKALRLSRGREIRIAQYAGDPMNYTVIENNFRRTGKQGILLGIKQELYIRPALD